MTRRLPSNEQGRYLSGVLTMGWVLPAAMAAGAGLGWILDRVLGIFPVLTIAFGVIGVVAGLRQVYRESKVIAAGDGKGDPGKGGTGP